MSNPPGFVRSMPAAEPASSGEAGARSKPAPTPQPRFIPREALGHFSSWQPRAIEAGTAADATPPTALQRATAQALATAAGSAAASMAAPATTQATAQVGAQATAQDTTAAGASVASSRPATASAAWAAARQAGYQDGYRDGVAALENFKQSYANQITSQVGALLAAFDAQLLALDTELAKSLAHAAAQLARELLRSELHTRPELVAQVAADAVAALLPTARQITVFAHAQDLPLIAQGAPEALAARGARLVADTTLARGGVRVESDIGRVDAQISTRWQQAAASLGSNSPLVDNDSHAPAASHPRS